MNIYDPHLLSTSVEKAASHLEAIACAMERIERHLENINYNLCSLEDTTYHHPR
jgi:hypothetical protein